MTAPATTRGTRFALTAALIILGILFAIAGVIYEIKTAAQLPSFLPGHQAGGSNHHVKHGLAAFALALICWIGAWFSVGRRRSAQDEDY
jgi:uncharacterized membrane protein